MGELMSEEEHHFDYTISNPIISFIKNKPHFFVGIILMLFIVGFFIWRFPI